LNASRLKAADREKTGLEKSICATSAWLSIAHCRPHKPSRENPMVSNQTTAAEYEKLRQQAA